MTKKIMGFGKATIPVSKKHKQTGTYTSFSGKKARANIQVSFYPPTSGDPLYEESRSKSYESKVPQRNIGKG